MAKARAVSASSSPAGPHPDIREIGADTGVVHRDHLASIRLETDASAAAALRQRFAPFGNLVAYGQATGCAAEDRAFVGERRDADTKLLDLNARRYIPTTGLFLTPDWLDPVDGDTGRAGARALWRTNPVGTNRYAYAGQDPINKRDPGGSCTSVRNCITGGTFKQPDGSVSVESSIILRTTIPGQIAWDDARTSWANGDQSGAVTQAALGTAEVALTMATMGVGKTVAMAGRAIASGVAAVEETVTPGISYTRRSLQHAFKHAEDFGVSGSANNRSLKAFSSAIQKHIADANTLAVQGTYRGQAVKHFVDREAGLNVIRDSSGNFLSGWKLSVKQIENVIKMESLEEADDIVDR